jgi:hypothetical protein
MNNIFNNIKNNKNKYSKLKTINYTIDKINIDINLKKKIIANKIEKNNNILDESVSLYYEIIKNLNNDPEHI